MERERQLTRRRRTAAIAATAVLVAVAVVAALSAAPSARRRPPRRTAPAAVHAKPAPRASTPRPVVQTPPRRPFAVGLRVMRLVDRSRSITLPGGAGVPRTLVTYVRYPALGRPSSRDHLGAAPAKPAGPFPLVVFGHGFAVNPGIYAGLLRHWASAGYVVAAPVFPLGNADAPGGPDESDLVHQPADMSFVISQLEQSLRGLLAPGRIAVAGQSDGGETALAVAYDVYYLDRRVRAAMILSGAKIPGVGGFTFPAPSPPLLATQGTADTVNPPSFTSGFYDVAPRPKFLVTLPGADHLGPYTTDEPQAAIVDRVTTDFLDRYVGSDQRAGRRLEADGNVPGLATLDAEP